MRVRDVLSEPLKGKRGYLSVKDVRTIIDVDAGLFQQWLARGQIPFQLKKVGKRTLRRFPIGDLPRLILIAEIVGHKYGIGDAAANVDLILNRKYADGSVPGPILWFPQIRFILFTKATAGGSWSLPKWLREKDCASCFLLSIQELKRKVETALAKLNDKPETEVGD